MLEEMEREFGISCRSSFPRDQYQEDMLDGDKQESALRSPPQSGISQVEEEKNKVGEDVSYFISQNESRSVDKDTVNTTRDWQESVQLPFSCVSAGWSP